MAKKKKKIVPYRKPRHLNIGVIIFLMVFIYMSVFVFRYLTSEKIHVYEVNAGSLATTSDYTGLILRQESVTTAEASGYVNYYLREGERASVGSLVYTLDESGTMTSLLAQNAAAGNSLSEENLARLKGQLSAFSTSYDPVCFDEVYQVKASISGSLLEYLNSDALDNLIDGISETAFHKNHATISGTVQYYTDGMENLTPDDMNMELFQKENYQKTSVSAGSLVESGSSIYKTITSDDWTIMIPITEADMLRLQNTSIVSVRFKGTGQKANAEFEIVMGTDGKAYGRLHLYKYMVQFSGDRFVDIELNISSENGLKIPVSSVVNKPFYLIPTNYLTDGNNSSDSGFLKETYGPDGVSSEFISPTIYCEKDGYYYVDTMDFTPGEYLILPDSSERYPISATASLQGVYNINKGYAVFKQIEILDANEDYYIVRKNMAYGLSVYDHIILNGNAVSENDIIYK
ncbi:MAG: hypothetical protein HFI93_09430 [Lachnospiraceae bacterium]|nr:hypothetical protein [Lachnospiraceae bacterium]